VRVEDDPGVAHRADQDHRQHGVEQAGPERCDDGHREQDRRDREHEIRRAHDELVHPAAEVTREAAQGAPYGEGQPDQQHRKRDRDLGAPEQTGEDIPADLVDKAIDFIRDQQSAAPGKPFFCYLAFGAAHAPHHAPREHIERYAGRYAKGRALDCFTYGGAFALQLARKATSVTAVDISERSARSSAS